MINIKKISRPQFREPGSGFGKGFTLIEILIALSLLSMILILVFGSLHTAGRSWESVAEQTEQSDEIRITSQFIRKNLSQAVPLVWVDLEDRKIAFSGKHDEVNFVVPLPAHRGGGGLSLVTIKNERESKKLMLYYQMATPDHQSFEFNLSDNEFHSAVLAENIESIEISYFGNDQVDNAPVWLDSWENEDRLPLQVHLKINTVRPSISWPDMEVAIRPQAEIGQPQFYQVTSTR